MRAHQPRHKTMWMLLALLSAVIAMMVMLRQCSHRQTPLFSNEIVKSGGDTLDIAIQMNPTIYMVRGDSVSGRDYELLARISAEHGVPMKFHPFVPLEWALDGLEQGKFDIVVASLPLTTAMRDKYLMTKPVYIDREVLVQLADSATLIHSQVELGGDTVWIPAGSPVEARIQNLSEEIGDTIHIMTDDRYSAEQLFFLVARGEIRYAVINEEIARARLADYPRIDAGLPVSFSQFQCWALRRDNRALADSLNSWLPDVGQ